MPKKLVILLLFALLLRLLLINVAFHGDLNNNISWGQAALSFGLKGFYERTVWKFSAPNQPPLYILLFGLTSWVFQSIDNLNWYLRNTYGILPSAWVWFWQFNGTLILVKLPSIFADLGIGYVIYKLTKNLKLTSLWLFNPLTFYNSAIWGQTDPIVNLLGIISIYFLINRKLTGSVLFIVLSILFKGSLVIFLPILLIVWLLQKYSLTEWLKAVLISFVAVILSSIWFHPSIDMPMWLFNLYTNRFFPGEIGYLTANAFNLWYIVNPGKVFDSIKYFGISAHTLGYLISGIFIFIALLRNKSRLTKEKNFLFLLAISALVSFLFFTRIHERYLYPFFPVATLLIGFAPEYLIPYLILSVTFLLNMYNLFWAPGIPQLQTLLTATSLPVVLSIVNLGVFLGIILI